MHRFIGSSFKGKAALVTGASRGIGQAVVKALGMPFPSSFLFLSLAFAVWALAFIAFHSVNCFGDVF